MGDWLGWIALPAAAFLSTWAVLGLVAGFVFRLTAARLASVEPAQRAVFLLAIALAPVAVAGLTTLLVFVPALGGPFVDGHCHAGSCAPHIPAVTMQGWIGVSLALAVFAMTATALAVLGHALSRTVGLGRMLLAISRKRRDDYDVLETDAPGAWCVGLLRPRVLMTRGLIARLPAHQLRVVLAHEHGHALRWDNLRHLLAGIATFFTLRATRQRLLAALRLAAEQACDRMAVEHVGNRRQVVETLAAVADACQAGAPGQAASAFRPDATRRRVAALTDQSGRTFSRWGMALAIVSAYALLTVGGAGLVHHALEMLPVLRPL